MGSYPSHCFSSMRSHEHPYFATSGFHDVTWTGVLIFFAFFCTPQHIPSTKRQISNISSATFIFVLFVCTDPSINCFFAFPRTLHASLGPLTLVSDLFANDCIKPEQQHFWSDLTCIIGTLVVVMQNVSIPCLLWQFIFASEVNLYNNVGIFAMTRFSVTLWRSGALKKKKMVHCLRSVD